jgi:putative DNA primase/helicase
VSAEHVARALGGRSSPTGFVCPCPVPGHGSGRGDRRPSLSVADGEGGRLLVHCFGGCDPLDVLNELRRRGLIEPLERRARPPVRRWRCPRPKLIAEPDPRALAIWRGAKTHGDVVRAYLASRRITIPVPPTIRQGVGSLAGRAPIPMLVAAVQAADRRIVAVQELRLSEGGAKASVALQRLTIGRLFDGAVRLGPAGANLGLAEGVETGLSAMQLSGVTVWCSLGSERLDLVAIPAEVRELLVFADNDEPGRRAADKTAERWARRAITVKLRFPPEGFGDWNDYLQARAVAA